ncbi:response regulator transcription factor [Teredinibacter franksiae]|mgnify:CR=1 FL=1|uniref:response regulator transcription factor n=1 Tax=Teredinibacter franksiae TaxID=2761453 RepID=UPI0016239E86|nr:response regulator transcription factor [Teredinibacter franksiae]
MKMLIVEDEDAIRQQLADYFSAQNFVIETAADGEDGCYFATEYDFDLAVIDIGLPKMDGIEIIKRLRAAGKKYPVLVLTARGHWQDKVKGLEAGADDYLVKPFHTEELRARANALIRRSGGSATPQLNFGPIIIDTSTKQVSVNQSVIELTSYEYNTLEYLALHPGQPISKTELTEHLYHQDFERDSNVIEVFIGRLRKKLDPDNHLKPISTVRGQGYRFALQQGS